MYCAKGLRHKDDKTARWLLPKPPFPDLLRIPCFSGLATCSFVQRSLNGYCLLLEKTALSSSPSSARDNTRPSVTHACCMSQ